MRSRSRLRVRMARLVVLGAILFALVLVVPIEWARRSSTMRRLALEAGLPAEAITLDFAGFSTHDTCLRAAAIFGVRDAVVVRQGFHVERAIATCRASGIDAVGLSVSEDQYGSFLVASLRARDRAATVKAALTSALGVRPKMLGSFVGLTGSAELPPLNLEWDARLEARRR